MADIAINPVSRRVQFTGNTGTGPFAFTFNILADEDIAVYKNTTLLTLTTDYTVSTNADGTGSVTLVSALIASDVLTIIGGRELERTTDFVTAGDLLAASLNEQLDSLVIMAQQLDEKLTRSVKVNPGDVFTDLELPGKDARKGTVLGFNATSGDPEAGPEIADVGTLAAITADISTLADIEDGTDATDAIQTVAGISSNVTTVSGISANVTTVAGISSDVTTVAGDATDIGTVATNIASVNTVATNIADVITVANDLNEAVSEVVTVADDLNEAVSEIDTVASSISNVDTVGTNIANVNTVAGISANVTTVAGISANTTTVAGISANVTTVAGISSDVTAVAADATDIGTVAGISANVTTVAGLSSSVSALALISSDITTVAGISANVTTVAGDTTNIATIATNLNGTDTIGTVAGSISNVNTVGGSISNVNTVATNLSSINDFADKYRIGATDPTTDNDEGDLFYNTTSDTLKVYTGSAWEQGVTAGSGFLPLSGGTLTGNLLFSGSQTVDGRDLSVDGAKLDNIEANADVTDATNVQAAGALMDSEVTNLAQVKAFNSADYATAAQGTTADAALPKAGGTMTGALNFGDNVKAQFGASNDLEIYHNGSDSIIADVGTGNLKLLGNDMRINNADSSQSYFSATNGGSAIAYHNGNAKLTTTSTGIDVTGTINADGLTGVSSVDATTAAAITAAGVGGGGAQDFTASGAIAAGDLVGLNTDGTVSKLGKYQEAQAYVATGDSTSAVVDIVSVESNGSGTYLFVYNDILNNSGYLTARAATYSGGNWTFGTAVTVDSGGSIGPNQPAKVVWNSVKSVFLIYYRENYYDSEPRLVACSVSGTTITMGTKVSPGGRVWNTNEFSWGDMIVEPSTGTVFVCWSNTSTSYFRYRGYTLGGTGNRTLTAGSEGNLGTDSSATYAENMSWSYDTTASRIVLAYQYNSSYGLHAISGTISGTTITWGSNVTAPYSATPSIPATIRGFKMFYNSTTDTHVLFHDRGADGPVMVKQFELNGSSVDWSKNQGTLITTAPSNDSKTYVYDSDKDRYYVIGRKISSARNPNTYVTTVNIVDLDTVTASYGVSLEHEINMANGMDDNDFVVGACYDASDDIVALFSAKNQYNESNSHVKGVVKALNVHAPYETFVGIATEAISNGSTGSITTFGGINENVSGLSAGEVYQISPKTGTLEIQKGVSFSVPTSGTEAMDAQHNTLDDRKPVGIAVSATKILLTPTR